MSRADFPEAYAVADVMRAAEALRAAFKAIQAIPFGFDTMPDLLPDLLDEPVNLGDLEFVANKLAIMADEWQTTLDDIQSRADEEDDRNRANPLSPNYRAYG